MRRKVRLYGTALGTKTEASACVAAAGTSRMPTLANARVSVQMRPAKMTKFGIGAG